MPWLDWTGLHDDDSIHLVDAVGAVRIAWEVDVLGNALSIPQTDAHRLRRAGWVAIGGYDGGPLGNSSESVMHWTWLDFVSRQFYLPENPIYIDAVWHSLTPGLELHLAIEYV